MTFLVNQCGSPATICPSGKLTVAKVPIIVWQWGIAKLLSSGVKSSPSRRRGATCSLWHKGVYKLFIYQFNRANPEHKRGIQWQNKHRVLSKLTVARALNLLTAEQQMRRHRAEYPHNNTVLQSSPSWRELSFKLIEWVQQEPLSYAFLLFLVIQKACVSYHIQWSDCQGSWWRLLDRLGAGFAWGSAPSSRVPRCSSWIKQFSF